MMVAAIPIAPGIKFVGPVSGSEETCVDAGAGACAEARVTFVGVPCVADVVAAGFCDDDGRFVLLV